MMEVGGSPTWTLTEDFALGMELKKYGWNCRYVQEYLAIGEAPDQIRNCYQQRSRWCKGHFQVRAAPTRIPAPARARPHPRACARMRQSGMHALTALVPSGQIARSLANARGGHMCACQIWVAGPCACGEWRPALRWLTARARLQILFNYEHCPLFQRRLSVFMRVMYMSGVWAYIVGAISTPTFIIIPIVTVWCAHKAPTTFPHVVFSSVLSWQYLEMLPLLSLLAPSLCWWTLTACLLSITACPAHRWSWRAAAARGGVFPIVVSQWAAIGLTVYMVATHAVLYYVRSPKHLEALWFSNVANTLMWFTYVKALHSALSAAVLGKAITFKTTMKGAAMLMNTAFRDMVRPCPPARTFMLTRAPGAGRGQTRRAPGRAVDARPVLRAAAGHAAAGPHQAGQRGDDRVAALHLHRLDRLRAHPGGARYVLCLCVQGVRPPCVGCRTAV